MYSISGALPRFHDVDFDIIDHNGQKWVTVKALAEALGYEDHRALIKLIDRNPQEFRNKTFVVKLTTNSPGRPDTTIINYNGVIRAAMLSDAPRASEFRDWAEEVLFSVMTTGAYALPGATATNTLGSTSGELFRFVSAATAEIRGTMSDIKTQLAAIQSALSTSRYLTQKEARALAADVKIDALGRFLTALEHYFGAVGSTETEWLSAQELLDLLNNATDVWLPAELTAHKLAGLLAKPDGRSRVFRAGMGFVFRRRSGNVRQYRFWTERDTSV